MDWIKLAVGLKNNAKFGAATDDGRQAFIAMLCMHGECGAHGRTPGTRANARALRIEASAFFCTWSVERVQEALQSCASVGLVEIDAETGDVTLSGYAAEHMAKCARCGCANPEPRYATCSKCRRERRVPSADRVQKPRPTRTRQKSVKSLPGVCQTSAGLDRTGGDRRGRDGIGGEGTGQDPRPAGPNSEAVPSCSSSSSPPQDDRAGASGSAGRGPAGSRRADSSLQVFAALRETPYRGNAKQRDRELTAAARRLDRAGITEDDLAKLWLLAKGRGENPAGLFAHWVDNIDEALKELSKRRGGAA